METVSTLIHFTGCGMFYAYEHPRVAMRSSWRIASPQSSSGFHQRLLVEPWPSVAIHDLDML
eukprot:16390642-Heterocapsa_arctica.AAC.1